MKKILRLCIAIILCAVGLAVSVGAADVLYSGTCGAEGDGSNLTWSLDSEGVLRIEGKGEMKDYDFDNRAPWRLCKSDIIAVNISEGVTSIGDYAFYYCNSLTSVTIPSSVISIGDYAFHGCTSLISISIPPSVVSIGENAFSYCDSLTSVTIPSSVTSIGEGAFSYCDSLTSVTIPSSVTSIGEGAFCDNHSLTAINVAENNQYYSNDERGVLFNKDKTILMQYPNGNTASSYIIPSSVTSIGNRSFSGCYRLTSVTIPSSVTSIGDNAFQDCGSLTSVTIPSSVTSIGEHAFWSCRSLTSVTIPSSVTSIGDYAFCYCHSLTAINVAVNNQYYSNDERGVLFNKDKTILMQYPIGNTASSYIIPSSVTSIGNRSFSGCGSLTSVTIPSSVTSIGHSAFRDCGSLTSVTIPSSVTSIGESAFYHCYRLTSVTIPSSVTSIGNRSFSGCYRLTSVTIPSSVTSIGEHAFCDCDSLTSVTIPSSMTSIGEHAFSFCGSLTSVTIPSSVTSIGDYAFSFCDSLTAINVAENNQYYSNDERGVLFNKDKTILMQYPIENTASSYIIPSSVTSIGESAFYHCYRLTSVTIPSSVTSIGDNAFQGCDSLTSVTIPPSVTSIGEGAFSFCDSLTAINVAENNQYYSNYERGVLFNKDKTILMQYPIGNTASSYIIPSSVTSIGDYAFSSCDSLTSVTIPPSVTSIGELAFCYCDNLQTVYYNGTRAQFDKINIDDNNKPLLNAKFVNSHPVLSTDIRSYIYGSEIESYNVNGSTCVVAEDLMNYGFTVVWDGNARTLSVTHPSEDFTQEIKRDFGAKTGSIGEKIAETVPTDIDTYVNGKVVPSFNIGGRTVIYIDSLAVFGGVVWDGGTRTISLG